MVVVPTGLWQERVRLLPLHGHKSHLLGWDLIGTQHPQLALGGQRWPSMVILGLNFALEGQKQLCPRPHPELPSHHGLAGWDITSTGNAPSRECVKGLDGAGWVAQGGLIFSGPCRTKLGAGTMVWQRETGRS